jgi:hypothetical protein
MAFIPDSVKEEIKEAVHLPEVIMNEGVRLRSMGDEYRGACPFEPGSTSPTKFVVRDSTFFCYDCQAKGDIFTWLMQREGLGFFDAMKQAATLAGVDLEPYLRPKRQRPVNARDEARDALLGALYELSLSTARAAVGEERQVLGTDISGLIERGEIGLLPSAERVQAHLRALGVSAAALRDAGGSGAVEQLGGRWVLWARVGERVLAARPVGAEAPVLGGPRAGSGWFHAHRAPSRGRASGGVVVALDDATYLLLRGADIDPVFRAVSAASYARSWSYVPRADSLGDPPTLVLAAEKGARRDAYETALSLVGATPRLRVAEVAPLPVALTGPEAWRAGVERAIARAGTVLDWQIALAARYGLLESEDGRASFAHRSAALIHALSSPVERALFTAEVEALTGRRLDEALRREAPARAAAPAPAVDARGRAR